MKREKKHKKRRNRRENKARAERRETLDITGRDITYICRGVMTPAKFAKTVMRGANYYIPIDVNFLGEEKAQQYEDELKALLDAQGKTAVVFQHRMPKMLVFEKDLIDEINERIDNENKLLSHVIASNQLTIK